ncbi:MAG TPA: 2-oxoglutarate dehydrogenase E1 component [Gemmatimonadaceae bacterium]|nr:2-oxoglutarate dehydrogenase E1 component [Gemmatimonadaceae bacterium]
MTSVPITGAFNDAFIAGLYEQWLEDPESVDASWRQFFALARSLTAGATAAPSHDAATLRAVAGAAALVDAIRLYGHYAVQLDPLGAPPLGAAELSPEFHGIAESDLRAIPGSALGFEDETAADAVERLRGLYSSTMGFEFEYMDDERQRQWFREQIETGAMRRVLSPDEKSAVLLRLTEVDGLERFLGRAYQGTKRFSIEGTDVLVPMIDAAIDGAGRQGARDVAIAMAHRGRINVLAHILDKPYATLFHEFAGLHPTSNAESGTGDVKYHLGKATTRTLDTGEQVDVRLVPNPSHLEFVNPVLSGLARATQRLTDAPDQRNEDAVLPIAVHGDAAFPGEGIVAETFNLAALRGFRVGGTLHIIVNNQLGFTTDPHDARSTYYASDVAKGFDVPIVHVNADNPEACLSAIWLALAYRREFHHDFVIDLVGYRRHGHNEMDEPAYTQPTLYEAIKRHPSPRIVWGNHLVETGAATDETVARLDAEIQGKFERIHADLQSGRVHPSEDLPEENADCSTPNVQTGVKAETLIALNERLLAWPSDFRPLAKLARQIERRRGALTEMKDTALGPRGQIDWGHAESLAFASLLMEGASVRFSGQDSERGTFSHRQAVLHDASTNQRYTPLANLPGATGAFEIYNSPLSETAVMGFEYGFSVAAPDTLVLWEAQFGDFVNVAQTVIDQFLAADRAKWGQDSGVVLLLPHGHEGQGPEHSSARLERFLQLCAESNLRVAYCSTPAQYFHVLRRQAICPVRRPLVLMQPKSLLRLPEAASSLDDLSTGRFEPVIDDAVASPDEVSRLVFCSGKIFYDLATQERSPQVALIRIEELYPWPHESIAAVVDRYPNATTVIWAQEEPKNMGAWTFAAPRLRAAVGTTMPIRYIGRPERASPAEGHTSSHQSRQAAIVSEALRVDDGAGARQKTAARAEA